MSDTNITQSASGDERPRSSIAWTCVDCKQQINNANHFDCPGKRDRRCKNCGKHEVEHFGWSDCYDFVPVKYAGGASSPERERELYEEAMKQNGQA